MPFHVKTPSILPGERDVYYVEDNRWTTNFDDRKVFENETDANTITANTVTKNGVTYTPAKNANATVVSE